MTTTAVETPPDADRAAPEASGADARGWYLYGITRRGPLPAVLAGDGEQLLEFSALAAVVRPVSLADFSVAVLRERLHDASALEAMVRSHNRVVEAIHDRQAILPAKFGLVYTHAEDVVSALRPVHDALVHQLSRLSGCDEWAIHLYADGAVVRERISTGDPVIRRLRDEQAAARPGRAYFLGQQLRDAVDAATEQALATLAQTAFDRMAACAVAAQVNSVGAAADLTAQVEILRASFLVARDGAERFDDAVRSSADTGEGVRCESSGPWPPYSFATWDDGEAT